MQAIVFPFDLYGNGGTAAGAELLADALREMRRDARRETQPARSACYRDHVRLREVDFHSPDRVHRWRSIGRARACAVWETSEPFLWLGGNHLSTMPLYETAPPGTVIVQCDAHLDCYHLDDCRTSLSHGNFLMHLPPSDVPVVQVGHRDLFLTEKHVNKYYAEQFSAEEWHAEPADCLERLTARLANAKRVLLDIDVDVFDPAHFPATPQPQPFGLAPREVLRVLRAIPAGIPLGVAISEFDPGRDRNDQSLGTLIWLMERLLLGWYEQRVEVLDER